MMWSAEFDACTVACRRLLVYGVEREWNTCGPKWLRTKDDLLAAQISLPVAACEAMRGAAPRAKAGHTSGTATDVLRAAIGIAGASTWVDAAHIFTGHLTTATTLARDVPQPSQTDTVTRRAAAAALAVVHRSAVPRMAAEAAAGWRSALLLQQTTTCAVTALVPQGTETAAALRATVDLTTAEALLVGTGPSGTVGLGLALALHAHHAAPTPRSAGLLQLYAAQRLGRPSSPADWASALKDAARKLWVGATAPEGGLREGPTQSLMRMLQHAGNAPAVVAAWRVHGLMRNRSTPEMLARVASAHMDAAIAATTADTAEHHLQLAADAVSPELVADVLGPEANDATVIVQARAHIATLAACTSLPASRDAAATAALDGLPAVVRRSTTLLQSPCEASRSDTAATVAALLRRTLALMDAVRVRSADTIAAAAAATSAAVELAAHLGADGEVLELALRVVVRYGVVTGAQSIPPDVTAALRRVLAVNVAPPTGLRGVAECLSARAASPSGGGGVLTSAERRWLRVAVRCRALEAQRTHPVFAATVQPDDVLPVDGGLDHWPLFAWLALEDGGRRHSQSAPPDALWTALRDVLQPGAAAVHPSPALLSWVKVMMLTPTAVSDVSLAAAFIRWWCAATDAGAKEPGWQALVQPAAAVRGSVGGRHAVGIAYDAIAAAPNAPNAVDVVGTALVARLAACYPQHTWLLHVAAQPSAAAALAAGHTAQACAALCTLQRTHGREDLAGRVALAVIARYSDAPALANDRLTVDDAALEALIAALPRNAAAAVALATDAADRRSSDRRTAVTESDGGGAATPLAGVDATVLPRDVRRARLFVTQVESGHWDKALRALAEWLQPDPRECGLLASDQVIAGVCRIIADDAGHGASWQRASALVSVLHAASRDSAGGAPRDVATPHVARLSVNTHTLVALTAIEAWVRSRPPAAVAAQSGVLVAELRALRGVCWRTLATKHRAVAAPATARLVLGSHAVDPTGLSRAAVVLSTQAAMTAGVPEAEAAQTAANAELDALRAEAAAVGAELDTAWVLRRLAPSDAVAARLGPSFGAAVSAARRVIVSLQRDFGVAPIAPHAQHRTRATGGGGATTSDGAYALGRFHQLCDAGDWSAALPLAMRAADGERTKAVKKALHACLTARAWEGALSVLKAMTVERAPHPDGTHAAVAASAADAQAIIGRVAATLSRAGQWERCVAFCATDALPAAQLQPDTVASALAALPDAALASVALPLLARYYATGQRVTPDDHLQLHGEVSHAVVRLASGKPTREHAAAAWICGTCVAAKRRPPLHKAAVLALHRLLRGGRWPLDWATAVRVAVAQNDSGLLDLALTAGLRADMQRRHAARCDEQDVPHRGLTKKQLSVELADVVLALSMAATEVQLPKPMRDVISHRVAFGF